VLALNMHDSTRAATRARTQANKRWKALDLRLRDANLEATENVRYLATLDQPLEVLRAGTPAQVLESLHALLQAIATLYRIARYYGTPQRMTTLFCRITNQMIRLCKQSILAPGKLWDQDKPSLLDNMKACVRLCEAYKQQYARLRDSSKQDQPDKVGMGGGTWGQAQSATAWLPCARACTTPALTCAPRLALRSPSAWTRRPSSSSLSCSRSGSTS
jgi:hypothetical protein